MNADIDTDTSELVKEMFDDRQHAFPCYDRFGVLYRSSDTALCGYVTDNPNKILSQSIPDDICPICCALYKQGYTY